MVFYHYSFERLFSFNLRFASFLKNSFIYYQSARHLELITNVFKVKPWTIEPGCHSEQRRKSIHSSKFSTQRCRNPAGMGNISCPKLNLALNPPCLDDFSWQRLDRPTVWPHLPLLFFCFPQYTQDPFMS